MLPVFFGNSFLETFPFHFAAFQSSIRLRFFLGGFFGTNFGMGVRGMFWEDLGHKNAHIASRKRRRKILLVLGFSRSSIFSWRVFCGGLWATNSVFCIGGVCVGSWRAFSY